MRRTALNLRLLHSALPQLGVRSSCPRSQGGAGRIAEPSVPVALPGSQVESFSRLPRSAMACRAPLFRASTSRLSSLATGNSAVTNLRTYLVHTTRRLASGGLFISFLRRSTPPTRSLALAGERNTVAVPMPLGPTSSPWGVDYGRITPLIDTRHALRVAAARLLRKLYLASRDQTRRLRLMDDVANE
jgi:hypothetical protein